MITNVFAGLLKLEPKGLRIYKLVTLGDKEPLTVFSPVYEADILAIDGKKIRLTLLGFDKLPVLKAAHVEAMPCSETVNLTLSDCQAHILTGQADESKFHLQTVRTTEQGGQLLHTSIGPVFSGPVPLSRQQRHEDIVNLSVFLAPRNQKYGLKRDKNSSPSGPRRDSDAKKKPTSKHSTSRHSKPLVVSSSKLIPQPPKNYLDLT